MMSLEMLSRLVPVTSKKSIAMNRHGRPSIVMLNASSMWSSVLRSSTSFVRTAVVRYEAALLYTRNAEHNMPTSETTPPSALPSVSSLGTRR